LSANFSKYPDKADNPPVNAPIIADTTINVHDPGNENTGANRDPNIPALSELRYAAVASHNNPTAAAPANSARCHVVAMSTENVNGNAIKAHHGR
jgi:hypothetical protein